MNLCEHLLAARALVEDGSLLAQKLDEAIATAGCGGAVANSGGGGSVPPKDP